MRRTLDIAAIPTKHARTGVQMRSRLECRFASFADLCGWKWSYEPLDLRYNGRGRIPDFLMHWFHAALVECKPATDIDTVTAHRRELVGAAMPWLQAGTAGAIRALDMAPEREDDARRADELRGYAEDLEARGDIDLWRPGRRALVVGSRLFDFRECFSPPVPPRPAPPAPSPASEDAAPVPHVDSDGVTLDGWHALTACVGHVGVHNQMFCLVCGTEDPRPEILPGVDAQSMWVEAGNKAMWRAPQV